MQDLNKLAKSWHWTRHGNSLDYYKDQVFEYQHLDPKRMSFMSIIPVSTPASFDLTFAPAVRTSHIGSQSNSVGSG